MYREGAEGLQGSTEKKSSLIDHRAAAEPPQRSLTEACGSPGSPQQKMGDGRLLPSRGLSLFTPISIQYLFHCSFVFMHRTTHYNWISSPESGSDTSQNDSQK